MNQNIQAVMNQKLEEMYHQTLLKTQMEAYKSKKIQLTKPITCFICKNKFISGYEISVRTKGTDWTNKCRILICDQHKKAMVDGKN